MARPTGRPIRDELVTAGRELAQSIGVVKFSYADVARKVGIQAASIHHHFPKKDDLVAEMALQYSNEFKQHLTELQKQPTAVAQLEGYRDLFGRVAAAGRMCLCGSVAAEWLSVGEATQLQVQKFFAEQIKWLSAVLADGSAKGELRPKLDVEAEATLMLATLEGAILLARIEPTNTSINRAFGRLIDGVTV